MHAVRGLVRGARTGAYQVARRGTSSRARVVLVQAGNDSPEPNIMRRGDYVGRAGNIVYSGDATWRTLAGQHTVSSLPTDQGREKADPVAPLGVPWRAVQGEQTDSRA
jgi:hypothetical protein